MTEALVAAAVIAVLSAGTRWLQRSVRVRHGWPIWGKVAHAYLKGVAVQGDFAAVTGWAGPFAVRFEALADDAPATGTRLIVWDPARPIGDLTLRPQPRSRHAGEIELGDPAFDELFWIDGNLMTAGALLDSGTRQRLMDLGRSGRLQIVDGALRLEVASYSRRLLSRRLTELIDAARRLTQPRSTANRWAAIATRDPVPAMRLRAVNALSREFRQEPDALQALRLACADTSPEVCLEAAAAIGPAGRPTLLDLAERGARCAVRAIDALDGGVAPERVVALFERAARQDDIELACACLSLLGRIGSDACVTPLMAQLEAPLAALAASAAAALGHTGSPRAEPPLIAALAHPDADVRTAAAQALGRLGSVAAVISLKEASEASDDDRLRRAARQAVAEIQSRIGGSPGELSMASSEAGQLSIAGSESGRVSLADDRVGGVSIPPADAPPGDKNEQG